MSPTVTALYYLGLVLVCCGAFAALAFVVGYTLLAPWWRSWIGRAMVGLTGALFLALAYVAAANMGWTRQWGIVPRLAIQIGVFALIDVTLIALSMILLRAQIRRR